MHTLKTFEEFLQDKFNENDEIGGMPITKDNYESISDSWFSNLDVSDLIEYGDDYGKYIAKETGLNIVDEISRKYN